MLRLLIRFMEKRGCFRMIHRFNKETGKEEPYLYRGYILRNRLLGVYLHQFWSSDPDHIHSHPWANMTFILKGGYHETGIAGDMKWRPAGYFRFRQAEVLHRISLGNHSAGSTWSLFLRFGRKHKWGFMTPEGWMEASEYGAKYDAPVDVEGRDFKVIGNIFPKVINLHETK